MTTGPGKHKATLVLGPQPWQPVVEVRVHRERHDA